MIHAQRHQAAEKVEDVKKDNRRIRDEIHQETSEALQWKKEEDALELARKEELIRQIWELEKIPIVRTTGYDPTETAGHGLLNEMSLAELREWLEYEKIRREVEEDMKRKEILAESEIKADWIAHKATWV